MPPDTIERSVPALKDAALFRSQCYVDGNWCAADIMYAPVVTRFVTYGVKVPPFAAIYMEAVLHRADVVEWIELAQEEPWVIEQYEEKAP